MSSRDATNFVFADSSPTRPGRKHRRGRGQASRKTTLTTTGGGGSSQTTSTPMLSESHNYLHNHPYTKQANYYASDSWDNAAVGSPRNIHNTDNNNHNKDDNSCTGSLTYSASSSVQSAESSNDSSFADIIKLLDSTEGAGGGDGGVTDVQKFIANNSMKAICNDNQKKKNKIKKLFSMSGGYKTNVSNAELEYSSNDESSEDVEEHYKKSDSGNKILETIAGHDDDNAASRTIVTSHSILDQEEEVEILPITTLSAPSTPRSRMNRGNVTPPSSSSSPSNVSRTGSRNSRSSSDGSIDTPTPSSPSAKPPHITVRRKGTAEGDAVEDLSKAFYAKSWMCGFTDAFNF